MRPNIIRRILRGKRRKLDRVNYLIENALTIELDELTSNQVVEVTHPEYGREFWQVVDHNKEMKSVNTKVGIVRDNARLIVHKKEPLRSRKPLVTRDVDVKKLLVRW